MIKFATQSPLSHSRVTLPALRRELASHRATKSSTRALRRELSAYQTPSEINDLLAAVAGQRSDDSDSVREILLSTRANLV